MNSNTDWEGAAQELEKIRSRLPNEYQRRKLLNEITDLLARWNRDLAGKEPTADEDE